MTRRERDPLDHPQIRFNWGYHQGADDARHYRKVLWGAQHFDKVYEFGYNRGREDFKAGVYGDDSIQAWEDYQALQQEQKAQRKALKDARPDLTVRRY